MKEHYDSLPGVVFDGNVWLIPDGYRIVVVPEIHYTALNKCLPAWVGISAPAVIAPTGREL